MLVRIYETDKNNIDINTANYIQSYEEENVGELTKVLSYTGELVTKDNYIRKIIFYCFNPSFEELVSSIDIYCETV